MSMRPHLKVLQGPSQGEELSLEGRERTVIGRRPGCDLQLLDPGVSGRHCEFVRTAEGYSVRDLGSYNGTFVNGRQVAEAPLLDRDLVLIGQSALQYVAGPSSATRIVEDDWKRRESDIVERIGTKESLERVVGADTTIVDVRDLQRALRTVYEVSVALALPLDPAASVDTHLTEVLDAIVTSYRADRACVVLDSDAGGRRVVASASRVGGEFDVSRTILDSCIGGGAAIVTLEPAAELFSSSESLGAQAVLSILCVPIVSGDRALGALYVDSLTRIAAFTHDDMRVLRCVAHLVGETIERQRLQAEADAARRQLVTVLEHAPVGVFALDASGSFSFWGQRMVRLTGREADEVVGRAGLESLLEDERLAAPMREALERAGAFEGEARIRSRSGAVRAQVSLVRLEVPAGPIVVIGSLLDIGETERLKSQLLLRQKLAATGLLVAGVCHDLRNFVSGLYGRAQLAETMPEQQAALVATTLETCEDARGLIDALLDIVRGGDDSWEPVDLNELVRGVLRLIDAQLRVHRIEVDLKLSAIPAVRGIASLLKDVLLNLVLNAQEAMDGGGQLTIRTRASAGHVVVEVEDTGAGIPPELLPTIFEPLATGRRGSGGTGLGLYMVAHLVEHHGGRVTAESTVGLGTCFRLLLPELVEASVEAGLEAKSSVDSSVEASVEARASAPPRERPAQSERLWGVDPRDDTVDARRPTPHGSTTPLPVLMGAASDALFGSACEVVGAHRRVRRERSTERVYARLKAGDPVAALIVEGNLAGRRAVVDVLNLAATVLSSATPVVVVGGSQAVAESVGAAWLPQLDDAALRAALGPLVPGQIAVDSTDRLPVQGSQDQTGSG